LSEDDYDDLEPTVELDELESRTDDLESRVAAVEHSVSEGLGAGLYSVGAALAVILSWQSFHALLWAVLAGMLSWFYVIYYVAVHWNEMKLL